MTEHDATDLTPATSEEFAGVFDSWIAGATVAKLPVTIYGDRGLMQEIERLLERRKTAEAAQRLDDSLGGSELAEIDQELSVLEQRLEASKSVWVLRGLNTENLAEAKGDDYPEPEPPPVLKGNSTGPEKAAHKKAVAAYEKALDEYTDEMNYRYISYAVMSITTADGTVQKAVFEGGDEAGKLLTPVVTVDQLRRLEHTLGRPQVVKLIAASGRAVAEEPRVPAPFLQSSSSTGRTS